MTASVLARLLPTLVAQQDAKTVFESMRQGFSGPTFGPMLLAFIAVFVVLLGILAGFIYARQRQEAREKLYSPKELFRELAIGHGMTSEEIGLLRSLARAIRADRPDRLFIRADLFEKAASLGKFREGSVQMKLQLLRSKLFAQSADSP